MSPMSNSTARKRLAEAAAPVSMSLSSGHLADAEYEALLNTDDKMTSLVPAVERIIADRLDEVGARLENAEPEGEFVYREGFSDGLDAAASIVRAAGGVL